MSANEKNEKTDFGRYLSKSRHNHGMTLEEVAKQTKISVGYLQKLENEDLSDLPEAVFVKGFIRAYANAVNADTDEVLKRFEAYQANQQLQETGVDTAPPDKNRHRKKYSIILILLFFVIAAILTMVFVPTERDNTKKREAGVSLESSSVPDIAEPTDIVNENAESDSDAPNLAVGSVQFSDSAKDIEEETPGTDGGPDEMREPPDAASSMPEPQEKSHTEQNKPLKLYITTLASTWLKVTTDEQLPKEMLLQPGDSVVLVANKRFDLVLGNAGGVILKLNDQIIGVPGESGQVMDLQLP